MHTLKMILHPTDFSDLATNAFHAAYALARAHDAGLILLYVTEPEETIQGEFGLIPPDPEPADADVLGRLDAMIPEDTPIEVETLVAHGTPVETIVQLAKARDCDLIVMGTHGRRGVARLLDGNVAESVKQAAPCPVLALLSSQTEAAIAV